MKKSLIFGHSSGLGKAVTEKLLKENIEVVGFARSKSGLLDDNLTEISVDLSDEKSLDKTIEKIKREHSDFDTLIYCSGILTSHGPSGLI